MDKPEQVENAISDDELAKLAPGSMILKVRINGEAPSNRLIQRVGSVLKIELTAKAEDNEALRHFLAQLIGVSPDWVQILGLPSFNPRTVAIRGSGRVKEVLEGLK